MPQIKDKSIGIIVYHKFPRSIKYLLLKHKKGHWGFAKGHGYEGETAMQTATRELFEEAGIDKLEFISKKILLSDEYAFLNKNKIRVHKTVDYFIANSKTKDVKIDDKEITNFRWCSLKTSLKILTYKESKKILNKANEIVTKNNIYKKK